MPRSSLTMRITETPNAEWSRLVSDGLLTQTPRSLIRPGAAVFTMGSCFAVEIRQRLRDHGCRIVPDYFGLEFNPEHIRIGRLPERDNLNYYHTFAIRQEFERCLGRWTQAPEDHWEVRPDLWFGGDVAYQDPYRRAVFARTPDDLHRAIRKLNETIRIGFEQADIFLITLGLTEVWQKRDDGRAACMNPGYARGGGHAETEFHRSTIAENIANLETTVACIRERRPEAHIAFTVSPVPLGSTATGEDVLIANMESKSTLRTAAAHVSRTLENVSYFPAYEICAALGDVYEPDGRHVRPAVVRQIVNFFLAQYGIHAATRAAA